MGVRLARVYLFIIYRKFYFFDPYRRRRTRVENITICALLLFFTKKRVKLYLSSQTKAM